MDDFQFNDNERFCGSVFQSVIIIESSRHCNFLNQGTQPGSVPGVATLLRVSTLRTLII